MISRAPRAPRQAPASSARAQALTDELWAALLQRPSPSNKQALAAKARSLAAAGVNLEQERPNRLRPEGPWGTALSLALRGGLPTVSLELIPFADPLKICRHAQGCDHLMDAASSPLALKALLARGADPLRADDLGRSALMYALRFDSSPPGPSGLRACVEILLPVSDAGAVDRDGQSVADWAAKKHGGPLPAELNAILARQEAQAIDLSCEPASGASLNSPGRPRV